MLVKHDQASVKHSKRIVLLFHLRAKLPKVLITHWNLLTAGERPVHSSSQYVNCSVHDSLKNWHVFYFHNEQEPPMGVSYRKQNTYRTTVHSGSFSTRPTIYFGDLVLADT